MQIFANGKQRFYPFMEFYGISEKLRGKNLIIVPILSMYNFTYAP